MIVDKLCKKNEQGFFSSLVFKIQWKSAQLWKKRSRHQEEPEHPCRGERMALQAGELLEKHPQNNDLLTVYREMREITRLFHVFPNEYAAKMQNRGRSLYK